MYLVCRKRALIVLKRESEANINKCCWLLCKISTSQGFTWILTLITKLNLCFWRTHQPPQSLNVYVPLKSSSSLTTCLQHLRFGLPPPLNTNANSLTVLSAYKIMQVLCLPPSQRWVVGNVHHTEIYEEESKSYLMYHNPELNFVVYLARHLYNF